MGADNTIVDPYLKWYSENLDELEQYRGEYIAIQVDLDTGEGEVVFHTSDLKELDGFIFKNKSRDEFLRTLIIYHDE